MNSPAILIKANLGFEINDLKIDVIKELGPCSPDGEVYYFQVKWQREQESKPGLLRVGPLEGSLQRELQLREKLSNCTYLSPLIEVFLTDVKLVNQPDSPAEEQLMILTAFPESKQSLAAWLQTRHSLAENLEIVTQICQFCHLLIQHKQALIGLLPQFIQSQPSLEIYDLTTVYPLGTKLTNSFPNDYTPPEVGYDYPIDENMSSYVLAALLYQEIQGNLPHSTELTVPNLPILQQLLSLCLSPLPEQRLSLLHCHSLLVKTLTTLQLPRLRWEVGTYSSVGLSLVRLHNEDNYGVLQLWRQNRESFLLAAIADGMGGMAQGDVASQIAIKTVLESRIPADLGTPQQRRDWLVSLFQTANQNLLQREGGTTLSIILAVGKQLNIAHVGDTRILLLRNGCLCQLSEDHSLVAMLLNQGEISYQESLDHPQRHLLKKSLGLKPRLAEDYVQDLSYFGGDLSLELKNGDLLILCCDGIWDVISNTELAESFLMAGSLSEAIASIRTLILERNAPDNATLIALQCWTETVML